jgi:antigen flippase
MTIPRDDAADAAIVTPDAGAVTATDATEVAPRGLAGVSDRFLTAMLGQYALMQIVIAMTGVVRNKVVAVRLGPYGVGELAQILAVVAVVSTLVTFGMRTSVSRNVAKVPDRADRQAMLANANGLVLSLSILGVIGMMATLAGGHLLRMIGIDPSSEAVIAAAIAILGIPFAAMQMVYLALLQGVLDFRGLARERSLAMVVGTLASVPLVWVFGVIGASATVVALNALLTVLLGHRGHVLGYQVLQVRLERRRLGVLASFGLVSVIAGFLGTLADTSVRASLITQVGPAANGLLQAPLVIAATLQSILLESVGAMSLTTVSMAKGRDEVNRTIRQLMAVVLPFAIAALGFMGLLGVPILVVLYSSAFVSGAAYLPFILVYELVLVVVWVIGSPLLASGDRVLWLVQDLVWVAVGWALSMYFIPTLGATAVVVGMAVAAAGQLVMLVVIIAARYQVTLGARHGTHAAVGFVIVGLLALIGSQGLANPGLYAAGAVLWTAYLVYFLRTTPFLAMILSRIGR